ncbi:BTAD domain-containing putative transcriptional regulator [Nonomuraea sp. NPDC049709]|uniref:AfsR/SARP family transcriptional regulator n=1 Tax=Nonomuraea sp. NPDC049709 TaxID=3154736 RepID=UPI0034187DF8
MTAGAESGLRIALLGPLEVWQDGTRVDLSSNRLRMLLAVLALFAGETVSVEDLAVALWPKEPPVHERRSVQTYISRLRHELSPGAIRTVRDGYRLEVEHDRVDVLRFRRLVSEAALLKGTLEERELLEEALALWRGRPFDGVESGARHLPKVARLVELHLSAMERWIDLCLAEGRHNGLVAEVWELAIRHPLREPLWGRLLLTLDRCGRPAEALALYEQLRRRLVEDLGVDPAPELQRIHATLLDSDMRQAEPLVPRQLPAGVTGFVGRDHELEELDRSLCGGVRICVISGTAGVGKTSLAVHWAHRAGAHFEDGQLYVDLQGVGPSEAAMSPQDALSALLEAMGVPPQNVPADLPARSALYRTMLAGKRILLVLDNAQDAGQVRWLLPGGTACTVLVTSRHSLSSLVIAEGAALITLDVLTRDQARNLLSHRLGRERIETDVAATDEIIDLCARLPLALAIVAGRAAASPSLPLGVLAAGLRRVRTDISVLATGDARTDLPSALSRSYDTLPADAARLFRLLAAHPGPDVTPAAAASLAGLDRPQTQRLLDVLLEAHLVSEVVPGRFAFHDLLRAYARGLARAAAPAAHQQAARRAVEYYLHSAYQAASLLEPAAHLITPQAPEPEVRPEHLERHSQALTWLQAEQTVLFAVLSQAMADGLHAHVVCLAPSLAVWCDLQGDWNGKITVHRLALEAAKRLHDSTACVRAHQGMASALIELDRIELARAELDRALGLSRALGDPALHGSCLFTQALLSLKQGLPATALGQALECLEWCKTATLSAAGARTMSLISECYSLMGQYDQAIVVGELAMGISVRAEDGVGQAHIAVALGLVHSRMSDHQGAIVCFERALGLFRDLGHRFHEGNTLIHLGTAYEAVGRSVESVRCWQRSTAILDELRYETTREPRSQLADLTHPTGG